MIIETCIYHRKFVKYKKVQERKLQSPIMLPPKYNNSIVNTQYISF